MSELNSRLIKAGAGTGKTYQLIQSISLLFKDFQNSYNKEPRLIVCTFTKKAAQEIKERLVKTALKDSSFLQYTQSPQLQISTIDGVLSQFLKKYGYKIDLKPDFQISDEPLNSKLFDSMAEDFIYKQHFPLLEKLPYPYLKDLFLSYYKFRIQYGNISFYDTEDFEKFKAQRQFLENHPDTPFKDYETVKKLVKEPSSETDFIPVFQEFQSLAEELFPLFIQKKKSSNLLEIEDLLLFSFHLLNEKAESAKSFCKEWDYWLIDEYQDTSLLQEEIIKKITKFKNVFCVGDPAQSIYSFRSADPKVFRRREQDMIKKGRDIERLDINRRSSPSLIAFYNDFFQKSDNSAKKNHKGLTQNNPYMKLKSNPDDKSDWDKACVCFFTYETPQQTSQTLSSYIQQLTNKGINYNQIAILSSKNKYLVKTADDLRKKNFPVLLYSSKKFSEQRLLLDSLFLLKFLINPYDDVNLKALLRTPYFKLSDQELAAASYEHHNQNYEQQKIAFWLFLKNQAKHKYLLKKLELYLSRVNAFGLFEAFQQALFDSGLMDLSYWKDPTFNETANLWKLMDLLKSSSALELFYKLMSEERDNSSFKEAPSGEDLSSIQMMTIHNSKGLEFEHVILLDSSIGKSDFRNSDRLQNKQNIIYDTNRQKMAFACPIGGRSEDKIKSFGHALYNTEKNFQKTLERDRLFYVAMTRAKKSLAMFVPKKAEKNSWLLRVEENFFKKKDFYSFNKNGLDLKSGTFPQTGYSIQIFKASELSSKKTASIKTETLKALKDYDFPASQSALQKSSKDFVQYTLKEKASETKFQFHKTSNLLAKADLGKELHFFLQKLFYFSYSDLQKLLKSRNKNLQEKLNSALNYVLDLKKPSFSELFKNGFVEWPFQFKRGNVVLKGQIDLWSRSAGSLYVVDYKSSAFNKKSLQQTEKQLIFYSWILSQKYQYDKMILLACYPFEQKIIQTEYNQDHKNQCEVWFQSLKT